MTVEDVSRARIGNRQVDWGSGRVSNGADEPVTLRPQSLAVLKQLVAKPGLLVTKDDLMAAVWSGIAVTDDSLVQCITDIRKALGDADHSIVKTLPKRGYIYEPPADAGEASPSAAPKRNWRLAPAAIAAAAAIALAAFWPKPPLKAVELPAIAVLPFINLSNDPKGDKFADMMTEDVITNLSHSKDFAVIARNSTDVYKGKPVDVRTIGKDLNVRYVLEGSVQPLPDKVRATAQLIDAETGKHIWSERIERPGDDIFAVEEELTSRIAQSVVGYHGAAATNQTTLIRRRPPQSWTAYDFYQLGVAAKHEFTKQSLQRAEALLNRSIVLDPTFARPHIVLAWVKEFNYLYGFESLKTVLPVMLEEGTKAVALDPFDGEAHVVLSHYYTFVRNFERAQVEAEKALELSPNNSDILFQLNWPFYSVGLLDTAVKNTGLAFRLNPNTPTWALNSAAELYMVAGDYERAYHFASKLNSDVPFVVLALAISAANLGKTAEAEQAKKKLMEMTPGYSIEKDLNEGYAFKRVEDAERIAAGAVKAELRLCMTKDEIAATTYAFHLKQCDAERAKQ